MKKIVFATNNRHKLLEVSQLLREQVEILSLQDIGCHEEIPETGSTLEENALQKARFVYKKYNIDCFADDTGLEVETLNNAPGVYSARYAGEQKNAVDNMQKLLSELKDESNRNARFRTVIALILNEKEYLFEGEVNGLIETELKGSEGFGYDPIFTANGYDKTFAELDLATKNKISHRGKATMKLIEFLSKKQKT